MSGTLLTEVGMVELLVAYWLLTERTITLQMQQKSMEKSLRKLDILCF
jgi:hypothetical protein